MRVFLIEPYFGGSHRAWAEGLAKHSRHAITLITHEAEFWRWRMRGASVTLAALIEDEVGRNGPPDAVLVSDMVDLAGLIGQCRRFIGPETPWIFYCHENQLVHPLGPGQLPDEGLSLINWTSMRAADAIWFNSEFLRAETFAMLDRFLGSQPDRRHVEYLDGVASRSQVVPVGVSVAQLADAARSDALSPDGGPVVLWNHRWDHDKNPAAVFRALVKLAEADVPFRFVLAGENQRVDPQEFQWVQEQLGDRVIHVGHAPADQYQQLLLAADVVVSASHHEFFGISVVEAVAAGAVPVLPDRLSYPEIMPSEFHHAALYPEGELRLRLESVLTDLDAARSACIGLREAMRRWDWSTVIAAYDNGLAALVDDSS